jgi:hypothetical protein
LESLSVTWWGIASETGALNTINLFVAILAGAIVVGGIFKVGTKALPVGQEDTYAAGAAIPKGKYHYTVDFYNPFYRMVKPYLKDFIDMLYIRLAEWIQQLCAAVRRLYTGYVGQYVMYIVLFLALLVFIQVKWSPW